MGEEEEKEARKKKWLETGAKGCGIPKRFWDAKLMDFPKQIAEKCLMPIRSKRWVYICGPTGTGKTHLACALTRAVYIVKWECAFIHSADLLGEIRNAIKWMDMDVESSIKSFSDMPFLALDDLGTEKRSEWAMETLDRIVNARYNEEKVTVITGNLTLEQYEQDAPRIVSRLREMAAIVFLKDVRGERR